MRGQFKIYHFFIVLIGIILPFKVWSQRTEVYKDLPKLRSDAAELFRNEKYASAQSLYDQISNQLTISTEEKSAALYYSALCAYHLFNGDAELRMKSFVNDFPESSYTGTACFYLGNIYYRSKSFKEALTWYEKSSEERLNREQQSEITFKKGYCYLNRHDTAKAEKLFASIKDNNNAFAAPATYYFSHLAYIKGNYETALIGFKKFEPSSPFYPLIPFYTSQIYYLQKKYSELIAYLEPRIDSVNSKRGQELMHMLADSYFKTGKYDQCLKSLEKFTNAGGKTERNDEYQIAYCNYRNKQYPNAVMHYQKVIRGADSLTQISYYQLADCFLQLKDKKQARSSFESASELTFYPDIAEDALFNYAKLSYELSYNPYQEAIIAFQRYIDAYPQSSRAEEAYKYLARVYMGTRNYKDALVSIEKIKKIPADLQLAYQKILLFRGMELFNERDYNGAIPLFEKSRIQKADKSTGVLAAYWKAECFMQLQDYDKAIQYYEDFIEQPGAGLSPFYTVVNYHIGYAWFKQENFEKAKYSFRKYLDEEGSKREKRVTDAILRTADCYYVEKDYKTAYDYYSKAVSGGLYDADYARYQQAVTAGLSGRTNEKTELLEKLIEKSPSSNYADDAMYDLGSTYFNRSEFQVSLQYFNRLREEYKKSNYVKKAMLKTGLIYYNTDKDQEAIAMFRQVIATYPASQEAREAVLSMRNIYVETGDIASFEDFVRSTPGVQVSGASLDSATYEAAERKFMSANYADARKDLGTYLEKYPQGLYKVNATYYLAESENHLNPGSGLENYRSVAAITGTKFWETANLKAATILFTQSKYQEAIEYYTTLMNGAEVPQNQIEGTIGLMRCQAKTGLINESLITADKLLQFEKISKSQQSEAWLTKAKAYILTGENVKADEWLKKTATGSQSEMGAEAHYLLAETAFKRKDHENCEKEIFKLIERVPSYDYWIAKSFILLADNYKALGDNFQASETLKSIIEKCEIPELVKSAQEKLNEIEEEKIKNEIKPEQTAPEIDLGGEDSQLFDSKPVEESHED